MDFKQHITHSQKGSLENATEVPKRTHICKDKTKIQEFCFNLTKIKRYTATSCIIHLQDYSDYLGKHIKNT